MRTIEANKFAIRASTKRAYAGATKGPSRRRFASFLTRSGKDGSRARGGFTLAESMIAALVLGVAVSGLAVSLQASHQNSQEANEQGQIVQYGRALVEELSAKAFVAPASPDKPGWSGGQTNRSLYDDVFDYNGYTDRVLVNDSSILVQGAANYSTSPGYTRSVAVAPMLSPSLQASNKSTARFARIRVTVQAPSGSATTLEYWSSRTAWRK